MQIVWLKRDLRLQHHEPLRLALEGATHYGRVLPVYVHEPVMLARRDAAAQHSGFIRETLDELRLELKSLGGDLLELVGEPSTLFAQIHATTQISRLLAYQETTTVEAFERDKTVARWCRTAGVRLVEVEQNAVKRGSHFTANGFNFGEHITQDVSSCTHLLAGPQAFAVPPFASCAAAQIPTGAGTDKPGRARGGARAANALLESFMTPEKLLRYPSSISSPNTAFEGCSRMSAYLSFGVISDQAVFSRLVRAAQEHADRAPGQVEAFKRTIKFFTERLYWRSAYLQSMERRPQSEDQGDLTVFNGIREAELNPGWLEAWAKGETGYPMIDASMRMLAETGWVHMRARGMLASFAVNELWLPWQDVGFHLAREFLDYEPAIHWSQLQIHAGTSRLSSPLTYNAVKQAQDHDPKGLFVRKWVPALANVPLEYLFEPWTMPRSVQMTSGCQVGGDYPAPVVRLQAAHDAAKQRVAALREGRRPPTSLYWKQRDQERATAHQGSLF